MKNPYGVELWIEAEAAAYYWLERNNLIVDFAVGSNQYADMDLLCVPRPIGKGFSVSVKCQLAAAKYGNFSFEMSLLSHSGAVMPGNFTSSKTDFSLIVVPEGEEFFNFYVWDTQEL